MPSLITRTAKKIAALRGLNALRSKRAALTAARIAALTKLQAIRRRRTAPAPAHMEGVDFVSMAPAAVKATGARFAMRYLSRTPSKNITAREAAALHKLGIGIGLVWETTADRAKDGIKAGSADAAEAARQAHAVGYPVTSPLYFAVDFDAAGHPGVVDAYFRGVRQVIGSRAGVYGSYEVVKHLRESLGMKWLWQTYAWSRGLWYGTAQIQQYRNGAQYDHDRTTTSAHGLWMP